MNAARVFALAVLLGAACGTAQPGGMSGPSMGRKGSGQSLQSDDILGRNPVTSSAKVKHILIGWGDLAGAYGGRMDERARHRSESRAEEIARELYLRAKKGEPFEALMIEHSEDSGTASTGASLEVAPYSKLVAPFIKLSLRLNVGEIGVVRTQFGLHIIKRIV